MHTSKRMHFIEDKTQENKTQEQSPLHTSKRMHFIEERAARTSGPPSPTCIRQNVCTSLRTSSDRSTGPGEDSLHTSKRMHFIEDSGRPRGPPNHPSCIRQNVCTSLRSSSSFRHVTGSVTCIRQNVCTSLRIEQVGAELVSVVSLHTSKRMHFIEDYGALLVSEKPDMLAYVKTYALH